MVPPNVELLIEKLVLRGVAAGDRDAVAQAVRTELARLFAEQGVPASLSGAGRDGRGCATARG